MISTKRFFMLILAVVLLILPETLTAQPKYYLIVGSFKLEKNATRFTEYVNGMGESARMAYHPEDDFYYVFISVYDTWKEVGPLVYKTRENPEFDDAWAYKTDLFQVKDAVPAVASGGGSDDAGSKSRGGAESADDMETGQQSVEEVEETETSSDPEESPNADTETEVMAGTVTEDTSEESSSEETDSTETATTDEPEPVVEEDDGRIKVYLNTYHARNFREVDAKVSIIDAERAKLIGTEAAHELLRLEDPNNGSGKIIINCNIFGYREEEKTISLTDPINEESQEYTEMMGDTIVVDFGLVRYEVGDVQVMYNVFFFKDASIIRPESKFELERLLDMMNENQKFHIIIHGHTNGNSPGKIIKLDKDNKNYFSLTNAEETTGSAKNLSLERAYTVQQYLVENGVAEERMEIKGWAGKRNLYPKDSNQAKKNVRVEVEIVSN